MQKYTLISGTDKTQDIINGMLSMLPHAYMQVKNRFKSHAGNKDQIARMYAGFIRDNIKYHEDGLDEQIVKLPDSLLKIGVGDCKSFALMLSSMLTNAGIKNGLTYVSYKTGDDFTHVYNNYINDNGQKVYIDSCVKSLNESLNFIKKKDMDVSMIGSLPFAHESQNQNSPRMGSLNTLFAAPIRIAFLGLLRLNFRGFARALKSKIDDPKLRAFWDEWGGNFNALERAIDAGSPKNPLFGGGDAYDRAYAESVFGQISNQVEITNLISNLMLQGFKPPFNPLNLSDIGQVQITLEFIKQFMESVGNQWMIENNELIPIPVEYDDKGKPIFDNPDRGIVSPPRGKGIGFEPATTSTVTAGSLVTAAIPLLIAIPSLLRALGVDVPDQVDDVINTAGGLIVPPDQVVQGDPSNDESFDVGSLFTNKNLMYAGAIGIGIYLLTRKKSRK
jgi:hypothetical protein